MTTKWHSDLRNRIQQGDFRQEEVAKLARYDPGYFSRFCAVGQRRRWISRRKVTAALHRMEEAERAADKARQRCWRRQRDERQAGV